MCISLPDCSKGHPLLISCRIVVYGDDMLAAVVPDSAKPFNFQQEYGLTYEQVGKYPKPVQSTNTRQCSQS